MRKFIIYLRQCFCKHDLKFEEVNKGQHYFRSLGWVNVKIFVRCDKCGYHHWYWKP